jgi:SnoaL-like domain
MIPSASVAGLDAHSLPESLVGVSHGPRFVVSRHALPDPTRGGYFMSLGAIVGDTNVGNPNYPEKHQMQRQLTDREAITDLVSELGLWLDEKRFEDARVVLAEDVMVDTPGGRSEGIDAVVEQARRNHDDHNTQHVITNVLVDVDGDRATVRANLTATFAALADKSSFVVGERYRFEAVRLPAGWRLSRIRVIPVWRAALNLH